MNNTYLKENKITDKYRQEPMDKNEKEPYIKNTTNSDLFNNLTNSLSIRLNNYNKEKNPPSKKEIQNMEFFFKFLLSQSKSRSDYYQKLEHFAKYQIEVVQTEYPEEKRLFPEIYLNIFEQLRTPNRYDIYENEFAAAFAITMAITHAKLAKTTGINQDLAIISQIPIAKANFHLLRKIFDKYNL